MDMLVLFGGSAIALVAFILGCKNTCDNGYRGMTVEEATDMLNQCQRQIKQIEEGVIESTIFCNILLLEKKIELLTEYIKEYDQEKA